MFSLTFQQIETFLAVAPYQSLSKASETLYISQPALSKTLQRLEDNIGQPLFTRTSQGLQLTKAGSYLYTTLKPLYDNIDTAIQSIKDLPGPEANYLHFAVPIMYDFCDDFDPIRQCISKFKEKYPDVKVVETIYELKDFQNTLRLGFYNLIIAPSFSLAKAHNLTVRHVSEMQLYFAMSAKHQLAKQSILDTESLSREPFIAMPYIDVQFDKGLLLEQCRQNGIIPKSVGRPPNFMTVVHMLRNGVGISICWKVIYPSNDSWLKFFPLSDIKEPLYLDIAWRSEQLSQTAKDFIALLPKI